MHSAANRLADFAGRDRVNSATEIQTPATEVAAPRHSSGRIIFRYGLALGSVAAATARVRELPIKIEDLLTSSILI
jgi:hypothetical protein